MSRGPGNLGVQALVLGAKRYLGAKKGDGNRILGGATVRKGLV